MNEEVIHLDADITAYCVKAESFPNGVQKAHQTLHALIPFSDERKYFGLSRPENDGGIVYYAGTNSLVEGEFADKNLETIVIKKGKYNSIKLTDFMNNIDAIGQAFQTLIAHPDVDPEGYCVEDYQGKDVICMVRCK